MKKLVFFLIFFLFTGANSVVISYVASSDYEDISLPIGDGEENTGEETKNEVEEDDDEGGLDHFWISREQSLNSNLHFLYQEVLFHDLEFEVVVPPPKA